MDRRYPAVFPGFIVITLLLYGCGVTKTSARLTTYLYEIEAVFSTAEIQILLRNSFMEQYKNRATITTDLLIDKAIGSPKSPLLDADLHMAGRSSTIGLPIVAELINARMEEKAGEVIKNAEKERKPLRMTGAFRLWCEHPGGEAEVQGAKLPPFQYSNPNHVFELHPLTFVDGIDVRNGFRPVKGYIPGDPNHSFGHYESLKLKITPEGERIKLETTRASFNDVEFIMQAEGPEQVVEDGRFVTASVLDLSGKELVRGIRMIFVKGTAPEMAVKKLKKGERLHVEGIPRINLARVSELALKQPLNTTLDVKLPYEIIIMGVYGD